MKNIAVIGAGSWGTALGLTLAKNGHKVTLWEYNSEQCQKIKDDGENKKFLPGHKFPKNLSVTDNDKNFLTGMDAVIFSVPSQVLRGVVSKFSTQIGEDMIIVNTAKGIEISSGLRLSEVIKEEILGKFHKNIVVLSGPTHAEEVAKSIPTTILAAGS
ncbi:MAG: 2-dehydropantoate 2-reductase N-terminal domain-containing protein, partial [Fusobacteriaceae bacterium]